MVNYEREFILTGLVFLILSMSCITVVFFSFIFSGLFDLQQNMEEQRKSTFRPGKISNHRTHFRNYIRFCS